MMLYYRPQRNHTRFRRVIVIAVVSVFVIALVLVYVPSVRNGVQRLALPLWRSGALLGSVFDGAALSIRSKSSLGEEIEMLAKEVRTLQLEALERALLEEENKRLRELWRRRSFEHAILGRVLARPSASPYDTLVLDVGSAHDVSAGDVVVVEGVAIGNVVHVFSLTAIVRLYSAPGMITNVAIGTAPVFVEAEGRGAGNFVARVPRGFDVVEGDMVVLPDHSPRIFAIVEHVTADASDPFQTVQFKLPINLGEIDFVEVVIDGARPLPTEIIQQDDDAE